MLFTIVAFSIITVSICLILGKTNPEFSLMVSIIAGIVAFAVIANNFSPFLTQINQFASRFNLNNIYINTMLKTLGICYSTQIASQTCSDFGHSSIGIKIELAGKLTIVLLALPMFSALIETIEKLVNLK